MDVMDSDVWIRTDGWMDGRTDGGMQGWMEGWRDGGMDGWMDEWMDRWVDVCVRVYIYMYIHIHTCSFCTYLLTSVRTYGRTCMQICALGSRATTPHDILSTSPFIMAPHSRQLPLLLRGLGLWHFPPPPPMVPNPCSVQTAAMCAAVASCIRHVLQL